MKDKRRAAEMLAARYEHDFHHSRQVAKLAEALFELCQELHGLGPAEKELLVLAGLLHDIGWCEGRRKHHKRAYELITANPLTDLSSREVAIVANTARYHRRALPKLSHDGFATLSEFDREIIRRLSALLRIADGLDVTHGGRVSLESCSFKTREVVLGVRCASDCSLEIDSGVKKSDLFKEVFGRRVSFILVD